jgi:hypothetical protein
MVNKIFKAIPEALYWLTVLFGVACIIALVLGIPILMFSSFPSDVPSAVNVENQSGQPISKVSITITPENKIYYIGNVANNKLEGVTIYPTRDSNCNLSFSQGQYQVTLPEVCGYITRNYSYIWRVRVLRDDVETVFPDPENTFADNTEDVVPIRSFTTKTKDKAENSAIAIHNKSGQYISNAIITMTPQNKTFNLGKIEDKGFKKVIIDPNSGSNCDLSFTQGQQIITVPRACGYIMHDISTIEIHTDKTETFSKHINGSLISKTVYPFKS